ncbi:MAG: hypothetical protein ACK5GV_00020 [Bacteroidota bacterium]|jgi:hypothetical protein
MKNKYAEILKVVSNGKKVVKPVRDSSCLEMAADYCRQPYIADTNSFKSKEYDAYIAGCNACRDIIEARLQEVKAAILAPEPEDEPGLVPRYLLHSLKLREREKTLESLLNEILFY